MSEVLGPDDVQVTAPQGREQQARRFYGDLLGLAERIAGAGGKVVWDDELPGVSRFFCEDPWGNPDRAGGPGLSARLCLLGGPSGEAFA